MAERSEKNRPDSNGEKHDDDHSRDFVNDEGKSLDGKPLEVDSEEEIHRKALDAVREAPDTREKKIAQVKKRLLSGYYDSPETKELLITKLIHFLKHRIS